jgi:hypothetical protein
MGNTAIATLATNKERIQPEAATKATKAFRETLEFASSESPGFLITSRRETEEEPIQTQAATSAPQTQTDFAVIQNAAAQRIVLIPMNASKDAQLIFPDNKLTIFQIDRVIEYLKFLRTQLSSNEDGPAE